MAIYTFYLCNLGGGADSFEAFDLGSDADAPDRALQMLRDHPSCTYVAVWDDQRPVLERHRSTGFTASDAGYDASGAAL
ncbi:hypothetical protein [Phenylobacterium sp.]|uniref:hypothetical protein n=1 Tax=Phenylobacterium sp. TaxID=1871053 RepID=UPI0011F525CC|nr:hypothetical protein [Phenylobacterium sp.]THD60156.1 MAG: hypothetical protein E8A12_10945 [Phenylobacterium sp.]